MQIRATGRRSSHTNQTTRPDQTAKAENAADREECWPPGGATRTASGQRGRDAHRHSPLGTRRWFLTALSAASRPQAGGCAPQAAGGPELETAPRASARAAYAIRPQRRGTGHAAT